MPGTVIGGLGRLARSGWTELLAALVGHEITFEGGHSHQADKLNDGGFYVGSRFELPNVETSSRPDVAAIHAAATLLENGQWRIESIYIPVQQGVFGSRPLHERLWVQVQSLESPETVLILSCTESRESQLQLLIVQAFAQHRVLQFNHRDSPLENMEIFP